MLDNVVRRKTAMRLYDFVARDSRLTLKTVNVLSEELEQEALLMQQMYERVRYGRSEFARI